MGLWNKFFKTEFEFEDIFITQSKRPSSQVYFVAVTGTMPRVNEYLEKVQKFLQKVNTSNFLNLVTYEGFSQNINSTIVEMISNIMEQVNIEVDTGDEISELLNRNGLWGAIGNSKFLPPMDKALGIVLDSFFRIQKNKNKTILKNFLVKIFCWLEEYVGKKSIPSGSSFANPKLVYLGDIREHEIYFLYMMYKAGYDIVYLNFVRGAFPEKVLDIKEIYIRVEYSESLENTIAINKIKNPEVTNRTEVTNASIIALTNTSTLPVKLPELNLKTDKVVLRISESSKLKELSMEELSKNCISTVLIELKNSLGVSLGFGSGVVVNENGLIATNYHVIHDGYSFNVRFEDKREFVTYTVINFNSNKDIALLKIDAKTTYIPVCKNSEVIRGQKVLALGSPLGLMNTVSEGIISGFREEEDGFSFIQTTAPISPGSSGGALINTCGELVGIIFASFGYGQNLNLAVPVNYLMDLAMDPVTKLNLHLNEIFGKLSLGGEFYEFHYIYGFYNSKKYKGFINAKDTCASRLRSKFDEPGFRNIIENFLTNDIATFFIKIQLNSFDFGVSSLNCGCGISYENGNLVNIIWEGI